MSWLARRRFWAWPWELKRRGVLGINARNLRYVSRLNPRALYRRVDDKAVTKRICQSRGIPVPQTYGLISRFGDVRRLEEIVGNRQQFVVKPACGSGGRGVVVIAAHEGSVFTASNGQRHSLADMRYLVSTTLSGLYSLGGRPDKAIIEQRMHKHPALEDLAVGGTPDIRIIVYRGTPVMAMLRLPTAQSGGRANLHQGAVGVGLDIRTGRTTGATHRNRSVLRHPDSGAPLTGRAIPFWADALTIAASLSRAVGLGYVGVDIVLDASRGPMVLEANARPGLAIQIANGLGLLTRCREAPEAVAERRPGRLPAGARSG